jgi:hypothetical protein
VDILASICCDIVGIDLSLLGHICQCETTLWEVLEHLLCTTHSNSYCLSDMVYQLAFLLLTVNSFKLPSFNTKIDSDIKGDSHAIDAHHSLINFSVEAFEFHVNIGSVNIGASILLLILIIIVHKRCSALVFKLSSRIGQIADTLEMLSENAS